MNLECFDHQGKLTATFPLNDKITSQTLNEYPVADTLWDLILYWEDMSEWCDACRRSNHSTETKTCPRCNVPAFMAEFLNIGNQTLKNSLMKQLTTWCEMKGQFDSIRNGDIRYVITSRQMTLEHIIFHRMRVKMYSKILFRIVPRTPISKL